MVKTTVVLFTALLLLGCQKNDQQKQEAAKTEVQSVQTASTDIEVKTAKCKSCARTITKALEQVDGVKIVSVDIDKKIAHVEYVSSKVSLPSLETAIANAGYDANKTKRNDVAYHALDACCQ